MLKLTREKKRIHLFDYWQHHWTVGFWVMRCVCVNCRGVVAWIPTRFDYFAKLLHSAFFLWCRYRFTFTQNVKQNIVFAGMICWMMFLKLIQVVKCCLRISWETNVTFATSTGFHERYKVFTSGYLNLHGNNILAHFPLCLFGETSLYLITWCDNIKTHVKDGLATTEKAKTDHSQTKQWLSPQLCL